MRDVRRPISEEPAFLKNQIPATCSNEGQQLLDGGISQDAQLQPLFQLYNIAGQGRVAAVSAAQSGWQADMYDMQQWASR